MWRDEVIVTPAEQFLNQYSTSDMTTELLNEDHLTAKPTAPPLDTDDLPIAIFVDEQDAMVPPSTPPTKEEDNTTSSSAAVAAKESKRECITKYPEAYQIRCACCEIGAETCDLEFNLLVCFSYFLNLDFSCSSLEMDDKCERIQCCCLGCRCDPHSWTCCLQCKSKDCIGCSTDGSRTPLALQCFCLYTGFLLKDCMKLDCFRCRAGCCKFEIDNNFQSYQLCCVRCGEKEKVDTLPPSMRRGFVGH